MKPWNDYASYLRNRFSGRVQKISVNAGFTCPNRDGSLSDQGCIYCNNKTFNPFYCSPAKSISQQLNEGIAFFGKKYKAQQYLAYFQAYSNTYASVDTCLSLYEEALAVPGVAGLVIATRPDCLSNELLVELKRIAGEKYTLIELGIETTLDRTLQLINRCHSFQQASDAVFRTHSHGIFAGAHLILGLPGESTEDILQHAVTLSELPLHNIKLHQLQIIKDTTAATMYRENPGTFKLFTPQEYIELAANFLALLNPAIMPDRFSGESPKNLLLAPDWQGLKNFELLHLLEQYMLKSQITQGCLYKTLEP